MSSIARKDWNWLGKLAAFSKIIPNLAGYHFGIFKYLLNNNRKITVHFILEVYP